MFVFIGWGVLGCVSFVMELMIGVYWEAAAFRSMALFAAFLPKA